MGIAFLFLGYILACPTVFLDTINVCTCKVREWYNCAAQECASCAHTEYRMVLVTLTRLLEWMGPVVPRDVTHPGNHHLPQGRVYIEEECTVYIPGSHLAKMSFIPTNPVRIFHLEKSSNHFKSQVLFLTPCK